jgi:hypothetical protein
MIVIDRMALADCFTPLELVSEIFKSNPDLQPPIPLEDIAKASGITQIVEDQKLRDIPIAGLLVADEGKQQGVIHVEPGPSLGRRRFTIGHELGHFLIPSHSPCSLDLKGRRGDQIIEDEADQFSTELLLPLHLLRPAFDKQNASLSKAIDVANTFEMSVQATINRLISSNLWPQTVVVFFDKDKIIQYFKASSNNHYDHFLHRKGDCCAHKLMGQSPAKGKSVTRQVPTSKWFNNEIISDGGVTEELYRYDNSDYTILVLTFTNA